MINSEWLTRFSLACRASQGGRSASALVPGAPEHPGGHQDAGLLSKASGRMG